jgi:type VI secretion system protein ImpF
MADIDVPLLPSVLDRLLDDRPDLRQDPPRSRTQNLTALRNAVRRDLEALLNCRVRCLSPPADLEELQTSLVEYGVPDFLSANAGSDEAREGFRRAVEKAIRRFEPRFKTVTVELIEDTAQIDRTLRLRIHALMYAEPAPEYISFDSQHDPASNSFSVRRRDG